MIRFAVRVRRDQAEFVLAELAVLAPAGFEERDAGDVVEYVLYGAEGELPALGEITAVAGDALVEVVATELDDGWEERWRDFHVAVDVDARLAAGVDGSARPGGSHSRSLRVRPPWASARAGAVDVVIEPGQAFGTGAHASTRLTLELLVGLEPAGALADWGCGSGVLAIAAAKLGWAPVVACDVERESVESARAAAAANGVRVSVTRCDVRRGGGPPAPTVLANLVRPLLLDVAASLRAVPERLIVSGLEMGETGEVVEAFGRHGLREAARREDAGWAAVELIHSRP